MPTPSLYPGARVALHADGRHPGTVRFLGPVAHPGAPPGDHAYLGVDWDDPARGKHSGEVGGRRYFAVGREGAGSLVRVPEQGGEGGKWVTGKGKWLTTGVPLAEAVREKYAGAAEVDPGEWGGKKVEVVGWGKLERRLARLGALREVSVSGMDVRGCRDAGELEDVRGLREVRALDVSRCLFASLQEIGEAVAAMGAVEELRAGGNRLVELVPDEIAFAVGDRAPQTAAEDGLSNEPTVSPPPPLPFLTIRTLALTALVVAPSWPRIYALLEQFPNLLSLALGWNSLPDPTSPPAGLTHSLRELSLEHNALTALPAALSAAFPDLERLNLANNLVADASSAPGSFPALRALNLSHNLLPTLRALHPLNALPATDIRLSGNPCLASVPADDVLPQLAARLARAEKVNGAQVVRREAEVWYASRAWEERCAWASKAAGEGGWSRAKEEGWWDSEHPRFAEVVREHGLPYEMFSPPAREKAAKGTLAAGMLDVTLRVHRGGRTREVARKVPRGMDAGMLARMAGGRRAEVKGSEIEGGREVAWYLEEGGVVDVYTD
ncbi:hypothetical protein DFJ74DRAFT_774642 [Hyaloraphidium curvatum]|nr:hypothetical protein DFJ74DRAFT_774642 [Hyaloraphidium curvatum]